MEARLAENTTSKTLSELESVTEYFFWVKASTSKGFGDASVVVKQTTKEKSKCFTESFCVSSNDHHLK